MPGNELHWEGEPSYLRLPRGKRSQNHIPALVHLRASLWVLSCSRDQRLAARIHHIQQRCKRLHGIHWRHRSGRKLLSRGECHYHSTERLHSGRDELTVNRCLVHSGDRRRLRLHNFCGLVSSSHGSSRSLRPRVGTVGESGSC